MRSFEYLQASEIIFNKRGIGYFVTEGSVNKIRSMRKDYFLNNEINDFFKQISILDIPMQEIVEMYNKYNKQQEK